MTKRVFHGIFFTSLLVMLVCLLFTFGGMYHQYDDRLQAELTARARYVAHGVEQLGVEYCASLDATADRITLIAPDGTVLYDNRADAATMENHADREEFCEAVQTGVGEATRRSDTLLEKTDYYAVRLSDGRVLRVSANSFTVWRLLLYELQPVCFVLLFTIILSIVLANRISKAIVKPINEMDLENPDIDESYEELGPLLHKVNVQNRHIEQQLEELRRRQTEFSVIADNMSEGLLILDRKAEILSSNGSVARFFDVAGDLRGKSVLTLNRNEELRGLIAQVLEGRHTTATTLLDGRYYEMIANPVFSAEEGAVGEIAGAVLLIVDVTEKEEREKLRREFTANVSHELKTPLTSIYGVSDMLMNGMVKPEDVCGFAADIHNEAGRLIELVGDIIKLSELDEGTLVHPRETVNLYQTALDVVERLQSVAVSHGLLIELVGESATVSGVQSLLHELLYNLCDNAIKYNRDGGRVTVVVERTLGGARVRVTDTGIGIPREHLDRVFERFYRVDKSHSKKIGGTGLGLSIVKHAAQYHGASVAIESTVDVGTTVTITFGK